MEIFPDLYWDVAEALQAHSHPTEALHYYTIINDHDQVYPMRKIADDSTMDLWRGQQWDVVMPY